MVQGGASACVKSSARDASLEVPPHVSMWGTWQFLAVARVAHTHFLATGLGGVGCRRPAHLPVWTVSPHAPSKCVFQNTNLRPCYVFRDALEFLPCFGSKLNPRL